MLLPDTVLGLIAVKDTKNCLSSGAQSFVAAEVEEIEKRFEEILNQGDDLRQQLMVVVWDSPQGIVPSMVAKIADLIGSKRLSRRSVSHKPL